MRKKIGRKIYDTDKSKELGKDVQGTFGDPAGFEETLYKKGSKDYFLLVTGGELSQYPKEDIIPLEFEDAVEWAARILGDKIPKELVNSDLKD